jgi:hypothetical protein
MHNTCRPPRYLLVKGSHSLPRCGSAGRHLVVGYTFKLRQLFELEHPAMPNVAFVTMMKRKGQKATTSSIGPLPPTTTATGIPTPRSEPTPTATPMQQQATASSIVHIPTISPIGSAHVTEATVSDNVVSTQSSLPYPLLILRPTQVHEKGKKKANVDAQDWTVDNVAIWLKSRGFSQDVCDKFMGAFPLQIV